MNDESEFRAGRYAVKGARAYKIESVSGDAVLLHGTGARFSEKISKLLANGYIAADHITTPASSGERRDGHPEGAA